MIRLIIGDVAKLHRPFMLLLTLGVMAMVAVPAAVSHESAALQWRIAQDNMRLLRKNPPSPKSFDLTERDAKYRAACREELASARRFVARSRQQGALVAATQHPVGALGMALGHVCSTIGLLFILLAAAAHVAGEWNLKTIKEVLLAEGRRARFVVAKCVSLCCVAFWFVLASWAGLLLWNLVSRSLYVIPDSAQTSVTLHWTLSRLAVAPLILIVASVFAVFLTVLTRSGLAAVLGGVMTLTVLNIATRSSAAEQLSPAAWIASLMDFQRRQFLIDHVWADSSIAVDPSTSVLWLVVCGTVLLVAAIVVMRRRDVLS